MTNLSFEGVKRRTLNGATTIFNNFCHKKKLSLGNGEQLKTGQLQCYVVLWIHNIDAICMFNPSNKNIQVKIIDWQDSRSERFISISDQKILFILKDIFLGHWSQLFLSFENLERWTQSMEGSGGNSEKKYRKKIRETQ